MELRHYLQFKDFTGEDYAQLFRRTRWIKERFKRYERYWPLADLVAYLEREPDAPDAEDMRVVLSALRAQCARMN